MITLLFLDEEIEVITLNDDKLLRAIIEFDAKLLVIDPFQAYLGESEMINSISVRKTIRAATPKASA